MPTPARCLNCLPFYLPTYTYIHRFVIFAVVYDILRRVHRYPVCLKGQGSSSNSNSSTTERGGGSGSLPNRSQSLLGMNRSGTGGTTDSISSVGSIGAAHMLIADQKAMTQKVQEMMDGTHTMDEICVHFMRSFDELEDMALAEGDCQILILYNR